MRLLYTPAALRDMEEIERYIREKLFNPSAAAGTVSRITNACDTLKERPFLGVELRRRFKVNAVERYILCGKYIIFYRVTDCVSISRVLDTRTDYLSALLSGLSGK